LQNSKVVSESSQGSVIRRLRYRPNSNSYKLKTIRRAYSISRKSWECEFGTLRSVCRTQRGQRREIFRLYDRYMTVCNYFRPNWVRQRG